MTQPSRTQDRHPELVSGSMVPHLRCVVQKADSTRPLFKGASACVETWTLKQVQGDGFGGGDGTQKLLGISLEGSVG